MFQTGRLLGPTGTGGCCPGCIYTTRQPVHSEMVPRLATWPGPGLLGDRAAAVPWTCSRRDPGPGLAKMPREKFVRER